MKEFHPMIETLTSGNPGKICKRLKVCLTKKDDKLFKFEDKDDQENNNTAENNNNFGVDAVGEEQESRSAEEMCVDLCFMVRQIVEIERNQEKWKTYLITQ